MRRPSSRMQPHVVTVSLNTQGADQDGGRRVDSTKTARSVRCFVQPGKAQTIVETSNSEGLQRVTEFNPTSIYFVNDAGLNVHDVVTWAEPSGKTHVYLVVGYYPPCGTQVLWRASCEERV
jgi:hypothetical protein